MSLPLPPVSEIHPEMALQNIAELSDEDMEQMLTGIRERRVTALAHYAAATKAKQEKVELQNSEKLIKELAKFKKEYDSISDKLDKLEQRVTKIRALRLTLEG